MAGGGAEQSLLNCLPSCVFTEESSHICRLAGIPHDLNLKYMYIQTDVHLEMRPF